MVLSDFDDHCEEGTTKIVVPTLHSLDGSRMSGAGLSNHVIVATGVV